MSKHRCRYCKHSFGVQGAYLLDRNLGKFCEVPCLKKYMENGNQPELTPLEK